MEVRLAVNNYASLTTSLLVYLTGTDATLFSSEHPFTGEVERLRRMLKSETNGDGPTEAVLPLADMSVVNYVALINTDAPAHFPQSERLKIAASRAAACARRLGAQQCAILLDGSDGPAAVTAIAEGCLLGDYEFTKYKSARTRDPLVVTRILARPALQTARRALERTRVICQAVNRARDLVNEPPTVMGPSALVSAAIEEARRVKLACENMDQRQLRRLGCGGILAVGRGAREEPRMLVLRHVPKNSAKTHVALIGKAVTFDTGGHCLKRPDGMWRMKSDMAGGAAVIATLTVAARLRIPVCVTGIIPVVENAIGPQAMLPGEILRTASGRTVHVDNTDAEGRLILADALWYAHRVGATHAVDIATLIGSAARALGKSLSALFCDDEDFAACLCAAGNGTGELLWRMPLHAEYRDMLKHECADLDNTARSPNAGAIVAALFLQGFVEAPLIWAHLDIAGTVMADKPWKYFAVGATGVGVRLFVDLLSKLGGNPT